jgi:1-acyl-sn-glycerol-3-phosphate acyltransferase
MENELVNTPAADAQKVSRVSRIAGRARAAGRSLALVMTALEAYCDFLRLWLIRRSKLSAEERARWLHRWCAALLPRVGVRVESSGTPPAQGMVVANHLSYLDIIVLSAVQPCIFVAKHEIRGWPLFGRMARLAGTVFINRQRKTELGKVQEDLQQALHAEVPTVLFPEGTVSDGTTVLPFRSPLFEPAVRLGVSIAAAYLSYGLTEGSVENEVCYWGDVALVPHLLNMLSKREIQARVVFGHEARCYGERKQAALETRQQVLALAVRSQER